MEAEDDYMMEAEEEEEEEITQEDAWAVISAYFEEKGLVRQQLDSFDEFIQNTMQEIVDESADIEVRPESQHNPGRQSDFTEVPLFLVISTICRKKKNEGKIEKGFYMNALLLIFTDNLQDKLRPDLFEQTNDDGIRWRDSNLVPQGCKAEELDLCRSVVCGCD